MKQFDHSQAISDTQVLTRERVSQPAVHVVIGSIKEIVNDQAIVSYEKNLMPYSQPALATVAISSEDVTRQVTLLFTENGQPIIMGFLTPISNQDASPTASIVESNNMAFDIIQDGQHCVIQASKSITLTCGKSSITMKQDGEISINGEQITTKARKAQKIIGGSVHIN